MKTRLGLHAIVVIAALLLAGGCTPVAPWQRGMLAQPEMAAEQAPLHSARRHHVYNSRESAPSITTRSEGGGCGCY